MRRTVILVYGAVCYALFFATFCYAVGFLGNFAVPKSIDSGTPGPVLPALLGNLALLSLFALQHSVMARPAFKRWLTRWVPEPAERSTYVLLSSVVLVALFALWQPLPSVLLAAEHPLARGALHALMLGGFGLVFYSTLLISHFDLFGLRQVVLHFRGVPYAPKPFATPSLYRWVRHPLYVGWFTVFWATPSLTVGHALFAVACTGYILVAIGFEERDLLASLGEDYARWRARTPLFVPRLRLRRRASAAPVAPAAR